MEACEIVWRRWEVTLQAYWWKCTLVILVPSALVSSSGLPSLFMNMDVSLFSKTWRIFLFDAFTCKIWGFCIDISWSSWTCCSVRPIECIHTCLQCLCKYQIPVRHFTFLDLFMYSFTFKQTYQYMILLFCQHTWHTNIVFCGVHAGACSHPTAQWLTC